MKKPLTPVAMVDELVRLNDTWPRYATDDEQFLRMAHTYVEALDDLDEEAVHGGVSIWIRTSTNNRWPSPAQVREAAAKWIQVNRDTSVIRKHRDGTCMTCGAEARWAELAGKDFITGEQKQVFRMIQPCDESRHPAGSPMVPYPKNFVRWMPDDDTTKEG